MALQKVLGHASLRMTLIYAHLAPDSVESEARRIWGRLGTKSAAAGRFQVIEGEDTDRKKTA